MDNKTISQRTWRLGTGGLCVVLLLAVGVAAPVIASDWIQFRGPNSSGISEATGVPATWDSEKNIVWKTELPGPGTSNPVILGDRVFLTSYSGYAETIQNPGEMENLVRHVLCLDRKTGKILWSKPYPAKMPESRYSGGNNTRHGYASSTPTTDGERLYVFFGVSGVYAFDLDGKELWHTDVGSGLDNWGSATSPLLYKNLLIVNASIESKALIALDKATGKVAWKTPGIVKCWASPILVQVGDKQEIVLNVPRKLTGFDPETGKELWFCDGVQDGYLCPTPVAHDGVVYAMGARQNMAMAARAGGRGDVNSTHVLWRVNHGSNVTSPLYLDGHLYWFHEMNGTAYCLDAKTGKTVFQEPLDPKPGLIYASPTAADGKLYAPSRENGAYVIAAKPEFEQIAVNVFQDDPSRNNASIAALGNRLFLRTDKAAYCIGQ